MVKKKKNLKYKIRQYHQQLKSKNASVYEVTESLGFPHLNLDESELEDQDSESTEEEIDTCPINSCIKNDFFMTILLFFVTF